jgi:hypothetical protein
MSEKMFVLFLNRQNSSKENVDCIAANLKGIFGESIGKFGL